MSINESLLEEKLAKLEEIRSWSSRVISKLETLIRTADDFTLFRVNPMQYAKEKGLAESEAIDLFLHSTKLGLFEMEWHLVCASCGCMVESFRELANLHSHFICSVCTAVNDVTFDDYIQVGFTVSPQIRDIIFHHPESLSLDDFYFKYYLNKSLAPLPDGRDLVQVIHNATRAQSYLLPKQKYTFEVEAVPGIIHASNILHRTGFGFIVKPEAAPSPQHIQVQVIDGKFKVLGQTLPATQINNGVFDVQFDQLGEVQAGKIVFEIENCTAQRGSLWLLMIDQNFAPPSYRQFQPFLSGKQLLTTQTFRNLFRSESVQSPEGIGVREITFLFTDLKGSTELYEQIGDPKAYYLVRQHFDTLGKAIVNQSGAIVKTIGDAVMATFMTPADAVKAALEMLQEIEAFNKSISEKLILKIGIHKGHSIVVTLNDRLDYFGQTVNIAARVQGLAEAGEIYISEDVYNSEGVAASLTKCDVEPKETAIKGVSGKIKVYRVKIKD